MPTMPVPSFRSSFPSTDSETLAISSLAEAGTLGHQGCDARCSIEVSVVLLSRLDWSNGVCSCGSFRLDTLDDVVPSNMDTEAAMST